MKTEFFKERYDFELSLREQLSSRTSTPLTVTTALGGVLIFFIHNYSFSGDCWTALFVLLLGAFAFSLLVAVFSIFQANVADNYQAIADGAQLVVWHDELMKFYNSDAPSADAAFERGICKRYSAATRKNAEVNARKVRVLARANWALAVAAAFALIASLPYLVSLSTKQDKPLKIQIIK